MPWFTSGGLGLGLRNLVLFTSLLSEWMNQPMKTLDFRSRDRDRDLDKMNSSLETMVSRSRSQHWLHQFQLVIENSLKGATNYGNRATDVGTKHAVLRPRPRPRPGSAGLETETETWTKWTRVHSSLLGSDHLVVEMAIKDHPVTEDTSLPKWSYRRADWMVLRSTVSSWSRPT